MMIDHLLITSGIFQGKRRYYACDLKCRYCILLCGADVPMTQVGLVMPVAKIHHFLNWIIFFLKLKVKFLLSTTFAHTVLLLLCVQDSPSIFPCFTCCVINALIIHGSRTGVPASSLEETKYKQIINQTYRIGQCDIKNDRNVLINLYSSFHHWRKQNTNKQLLRG